MKSNNEDKKVNKAIIISLSATIIILLAAPGVFFATKMVKTKRYNIVMGTIMSASENYFKDHINDVGEADKIQITVNTLLANNYISKDPNIECNFQYGCIKNPNDKTLINNEKIIVEKKGEEFSAQLGNLESEKYVVFFPKDEDDDAVPMVEAVSCEKANCKIKLPKITKANYDILGWATTADSRTAKKSTGEEYILTSSNTTQTFYPITKQEVIVNLAVAEEYKNSVADTIVDVLKCSKYNSEESCKITLPEIKTNNNIDAYKKIDNKIPTDINYNDFFIWVWKVKEKSNIQAKALSVKTAKKVKFTMLGYQEEKIDMQKQALVNDDYYLPTSVVEVDDTKFLEAELIQGKNCSILANVDAKCACPPEYLGEDVYYFELVKNKNSYSCRSKEKIPEHYVYKAINFKVKVSGSGSIKCVIHNADAYHDFSQYEGGSDSVLKDNPEILYEWLNNRSGNEAYCEGEKTIADVLYSMIDDSETPYEFEWLHTNETSTREVVKSEYKTKKIADGCYRCNSTKDYFGRSIQPVPVNNTCVLYNQPLCPGEEWASTDTKYLYTCKKDATQEVSCSGGFYNSDKKRCETVPSGIGKKAEEACAHLGGTGWKLTYNKSECIRTLVSNESICFETGTNSTITYDSKSNKCVKTEYSNDIYEATNSADDALYNWTKGDKEWVGVRKTAPKCAVYNTSNTSYSYNATKKICEATTTNYCGAQKVVNNVCTISATPRCPTKEYEPGANITKSLKGSICEYTYRKSPYCNVKDGYVLSSNLSTCTKTIKTCEEPNWWWSDWYCAAGYSFTSYSSEKCYKKTCTNALYSYTDSKSEYAEGRFTQYKQITCSGNAGKIVSNNCTEISGKPGRFKCITSCTANYSCSNGSYDSSSQKCCTTTTKDAIRDKEYSCQGEDCCETKEITTSSCDLGYSIVNGMCQYVEVDTSCPIGSYDSSTKKCELSTRACATGYKYENGRCIIEKEISKSTTGICESGTWDASLGYCVEKVTKKIECMDKGFSYNPEIKKCEKISSYEVTCQDKSYTYNPKTKKCEKTERHLSNIYSCPNHYTLDTHTSNQRTPICYSTEYGVVLFEGHFCKEGDGEFTRAGDNYYCLMFDQKYCKRGWEVYSQKPITK